MAAGGGVLIVAEATESTLGPISAELAGIGSTLAKALGQSLDAVLLGTGLDAAASALATLGPDRVLVVDDPALADLQPGVCVAVLADLISTHGYDVVLLGQTPTYREVAVRLAFRLDTGITTDCTGLRVESGRVVMRKPVFGGAAIAEYTVDEARPQMATIRPRAFEPATAAPERTAPVESIQVQVPAPRTRIVETVHETATAGPKLKDAKVVVSGGRGIGGAENWHYVDELAAAVGGAVGATRAVTDAGWVPPSHQVGLTGTTITPDLYITVGVSGAVQHIAGCSGSRNIVAINKDPDANIFKHARYGIVGDYKQVVPALTRRIKELRG
ncbi:MAG: electron transfer flavoprotein subunit alpha/FixB family protein [Chloroflexi bacterium]|nr:electron transfer flavoprotein subunit alpha/FixB family protein [Chloroflexota bacterium]